MKKYIIPAIMIVETSEDLMQGIHNTSGSGTQLGNNGLFDDLEDGLDNTFKSKDLWDDEDEAR